MNELITFKGNNNGLQLIIDKNADFAEIKQALLVKLASHEKFFLPNTVITLENVFLSKQEQSYLVNLLKKYNLILKCVLPKKAIVNDDKFPDKIIKRTIRGGEEIIYKGSIIIYGNVNPGAKIIAGGNIDIHGFCRGIVHAGAFGDKQSFIVADRLSPLQIRIADFIARSPDNVEDMMNSNISTEKAMIKDGNIVLEPFSR